MAELAASEKMLIQLLRSKKLFYGAVTSVFSWSKRSTSSFEWLTQRASEKKITATEEDETPNLWHPHAVIITQTL